MRQDEAFDGVLLDGIAREPRTPSTIDIDRAIRDGRRRRRVRQITGYGTVAAVTALALVAGSALAGSISDRRTGGDSGAMGTASAGASPGVTAAELLPPAPAVPTRCTIARLPVPDGVAMALVSAADPTGRFIVGRSYPHRSGAGTYQVVIWHDGKATKVDMPGDEQALQAVNSAGTAVGWAYAGDTPKAWGYHDGTAAPLPGSTPSQAYGINAAGVSVGYIRTGGPGSSQPVRWATLTSEPTPLPLPASAVSGEARAITDDGTVVGIVSGSNRIEQPYAWAPDGTGRYLALPVYDGVSAGSARAYTARGSWALGVASAPGSGAGKDPSGKASGGATRQPTAARWNLRTGEAAVFPQFSIRADDVTPHGWQVGTDLQGRAMLLAGDTQVTLPDLATHRAGELTNIATTVSDDARIIAGQADDANGVIHAVTWTCS